MIALFSAVHDTYPDRVVGVDQTYFVSSLQIKIGGGTIEEPEKQQPVGGGIVIVLVYFIRLTLYIALPP